MNLFDVLTLIGGLCLFLFGMNVMGESLERSAGDGLRTLLGRMTTKKAAGFLTGLGVTAVIQSSSATTVMVVGFVNSGLLTLKQAINVIMGANVGTTVTAWILSLGGIESSNVFVKLLKPSSFTPVLALIGIILYMFLKDGRKKDIGMIFLGFATLMFGMETMSDAVAGLSEVEQFRQLFLFFTNPVLGVLAGAILTAVIQSSSASVGILQALSATGQVTYGAAIPIIMGQNIGTCITAILSSFGANKNGKRAAIVHLSFNVIGSVIWLAVFSIVRALVEIPLLSQPATHMGIAVAHSAFNILCTILLLPMTGLLEKLVYRLVPEPKTPETVSELDERLLVTPSIAIERSRVLAITMAEGAVRTLKDGITALHSYTPGLAKAIREGEEKSDHYEDILGSYLVKISTRQISQSDSAEAAKLLRIIGDFERISDHGVNLLDSALEMKEKGIAFSDSAAAELRVLEGAVNEILDLALAAFTVNDLEAATKVEALEELIDDLKEKMRARHITRLQQGDCSIEVGFVWSDLLTNLERTSDHCSNIAGCVTDMAENNLNLHETTRALRSGNSKFEEDFRVFAEKYAIN